MSERFLTREQTYASLVFAKVNAVRSLYPDENDPQRKAYGALAHKLPVLIRTSGLTQSLAFVQARHKEPTPQRRLLADLEAVLRDEQTQVLELKHSLVDRSREAGFEEYMRLTEAALEALLWFKRFAQSELKVEPGEEVQDATS